MAGPLSGTGGSPQLGPGEGGSQHQPQERAGAAPGRKRPKAPWGSFPLSEIVVFVAIVLAVAGFVVQGTSGAVLLVTAAVLGSLAGLELALREHLAGYRSHTSLLAVFAAVVVLAVSYLVVDGRDTLSLAIRLALAAAVFAGLFFKMRALFKRRSGGLGFR